MSSNPFDYVELEEEVKVEQPLSVKRAPQNNAQQAPAP